jgi:signal transduction histidine kinase
MPSEGDPDRLAQALTNLVANAVKYRRDDTSVRVSIRRAPNGARIEIHNEGEPIPAELLPHLFEAFRQGDPQPSQRAPGLGLGLYIAQQVIQAHGGSITVASLPEQGTTFSVDLPFSPRA